MKKSIFILMAMLFAVSASAQEQDMRETRIFEPNAIGAGSPIDVTQENSEVTVEYGISWMGVLGGDYITRIVFTGYNPGKEILRHLTVELCSDWDEHRNNIYATVFDGECTIPAGGTADGCIPLLTIDLPEPYRMKSSGNLYLKVSSSGEPASTPVYFERHEETSSYGRTFIMPTMLLTILSDVSYFETRLSDQDGNPVAGATVSLQNYFLTFDGKSDDEGKVVVRVGDNNSSYQLTVAAEGLPEYKSGYFYVREVSSPATTTIPAPDEVVVYNRLDFTAGHPATLILPEAPNRTWGRYYRLDRHEGRDIIFEREYEPKGGIPYVIIPNEDFSINLGDYDLIGLAEPEIVPFPDNKEYSHCGFIGSYSSQFPRMDLYDGEFLYFMDTTPDCVFDVSNVYSRRIGACRAYLVLGAFSVEMRYEGPRYVFVGETDGITERHVLDNSPDRYYDLQGRRLLGRPEKGIYIREGRKYVAK